MQILTEEQFEELMLNRNRVIAVGPVDGKYWDVRMDKKGCLNLTVSEKQVTLKAQDATGVGEGAENAL